MEWNDIADNIVQSQWRSCAKAEIYIGQDLVAFMIVGKVKFCLENTCKIIHFELSQCQTVPKNGSKQIRW